MHELNLCNSLCIPVKEVGKYHGMKGMDLAHEFREAAVVLMASPMTPGHVIYASRPVKNGSIVTIDQLRTEEGIDAAIGSYAPNNAVDPDPRCNPVFAAQDQNLRAMAEKLFQYGHKRVVIFSHNGYGNLASADSNEDGVLVKDSVAYAVRLNGEEKTEFVKGIPGAAQNTGHEHVHVLPGSIIENGRYIRDLQFADVLRARFDEYFAGSPLQQTLEEHREMQRAEREVTTTISFAVLRQGDVDNVLIHSFYDAARLSPDAPVNPEKGIAGLVRGIISKSTLDDLGMNVNDKTVSKKIVQATRELYKYMWS